MAARSLLRERDLASVAAAVFASTAGDWVALLALTSEVGGMRESGFAIAGLFIAVWLPVAVLAGHVGVLVDRVETTRLLACTALVQVALAGGLAFVQPLWAIYLLLALLGCGFAVSQACEFAIVPSVVAPGRVGEANGIVEAARYVGFMAGPALGGVLTATLGRQGALLVDAATFGFVALVALTLRATRPATVARRGEARARDGIGLLLSSPELRLAMVVAFVSLLFMSASIPADVLYVRDVLEDGSGVLGLVLTGWTLGMVVAAVIVAKRIPVELLLVAAFVGTVLQGAGKAVTPIVPVALWMLCWYVVGGFGHGIKNVTLRTLIHRSVRHEAHGRAFAAYNGLRNTAEIIALLGGAALVDRVGASATLVVAGGVSAAVGLGGLLLRRRAAPRLPGATPAGAGTIGSP